MAFTDYVGSSTFWTAIKRAVGTQNLTGKDLYDDAILRVADRTSWLRDELTRIRSGLASVSAGSKATITGSVDLSTLTYDATSGSLNGKTMTLATNTPAVITITFGTGGLAPMSPGEVVDQINTASGGDPGAFINSANQINLSSPTTGASSTVEATSGSALALLGFTPGANATGASFGYDGASLLGVAAITGTSFNIAAGTLRAALQDLADNGLKAVAGVITVGHQLKMAAQFVPRPATLLNGATTSPQLVDPAVTSMVYTINPSSNLVVRLKSTVAPVDGSEFELQAYNLSAGRTIQVFREGGLDLAEITGAGGDSSAGLRFKFIDLSWRIVGAWAVGNELDITNPAT